MPRKTAIIAFVWDTFPGPSQYYVHGKFPQPSSTTDCQAMASHLDVQHAYDIARLGVVVQHDGKRHNVHPSKILVAVDGE